MRRLVQFVAILALGLLNGGLSAQQPGSVVVSGQVLSSTGCLTMLNNTQALKKTGLCSFSVVAVGVKLPDLECHAALSGNQATALLDTIADCTYSPIKKMSANPNTPNLQAGEMMFTEKDMALGPDGCLAILNNPGNHEVLGKCGFNVVLLNTAIRSTNFTVKIGGGNTTVQVTYVPVKASTAQ